MPTITPNETTTQPPWTFADQPSTVRVTSVNTQGFYFEQVTPPNSPSPVLPMPEVDWLAISQGEQQLSDGSRVYGAQFRSRPIKVIVA